MNTEQLLRLAREIVEDEDRLKLHQKLTELVQALNNFASNPSAAPHQTEVSNKLKQLSKSLNELQATYSPPIMKRMESIGALPYFTSAMVARLRQSMDDNPMTPAVVQQEAQQLLKERAEFVTNLRNLETVLEALGFEEDELKEGEAEIGFQIPRYIFDNELDGFSKELHELRLIIRAFSEAAGNAGERIELRQISTSDPLVFVLLGYATIKLIGGGVKWCLDQWKTLEEIRNLRTTTANLKGVPTAQTLAEQFDAIIQQTIETNVRQEAERLAAEAGADGPRQNELANHLSKALEGLLARIERGMTVEIRFLPPPSTAEEGEDASAQFEELKVIQQQLVFPAPTEEPLLKLTKQPEGTGQRSGTRRSS